MSEDYTSRKFDAIKVRQCLGYPAGSHCPSEVGRIHPFYCDVCWKLLDQEMLRFWKEEIGE